MNEWKWTISGEKSRLGAHSLFENGRHDFRRKVAIWGLIPFLKMDGFAHLTGDHLDTISGEKS